LLNIHNVSIVRQIEVHTPEPLVLGPSPLEVEIAIVTFKNCNPPGSDQVPTELIQAVGETVWSEIHKLVNSIWNNEELPDQRKKSIIVSIYKIAIKVSVQIIVGYHYQLHTKFYPISFPQGNNKTHTQTHICIYTHTHTYVSTYHLANGFFFH
jgi:hypothetical protein